MKKNYRKVMLGVFGIAAAFIMAGGLRSKDASAKEKIRDLQENGVNDVHIYTMNKPKMAAEIMGAIYR